MDIEMALHNPGLPKPITSKAAKYRTRKAEQQKMLLESAAMAFVLMENGEYRYPEGARKRHYDDGSPGPNYRELMRIAGYARGSEDHFEEYLGSQEEFWKLVELYRIRRTDPLFGKGREGELWLEVGNESLKFLYEQVKYLPHTMSIEQHIKVVKLVLDAGISNRKLSGEGSNRTKELLSDLTPEQRKRIMGGYEANLRKELSELESFKDASDAAASEGAV